MIKFPQKIFSGDDLNEIQTAIHRGTFNRIGDIRRRGIFFVGQGENYSEADTTRRTSPPASPSTSTSTADTSNSAPTATTASEPAPPPAQFSPPPKQTGQLNAQDLSLGVLTIDDPEEKVRQALGDPLSTKIENDLTRLKYDTLEV